MKNQKNSIWYRFSSEKVSYEIKFETTDIPIKDIKNKIIKRRNMIKYPERFDLIFYDEENPDEEIGENHLIKPMKHLIVKRLPHYIKEPNFRKEIKDPKDILMNKMNENGLRRGELQQIIRYKEPLEKISRYLKKDLLSKQFKCKICEKFEEETYNNLIITKCCKDTFCLNCYNKEQICPNPNCKNDKIGFVKNEAEINLIKKLLDILEKKEEQEKIKREKSLLQSNSKIIQKNNDSNNSINKNNYSSNNIGSAQGENKSQEPLTSYQLQKQLIEESQFYIVRSSNAENIQKSKNKSIWATTIANSYKLNQAFNKGKVILFFSVGNTQYFKGYAIMTSSCSETPSNDIWQLDKNKNIKLGGDFSVYWLCYCELPFLKTKNLNINKIRDCTELEQNIGKQLFELCYAQEKEELDKNPQRIKIEINEQIISKINDTINNSKNKQNEKLNNNNINNNKIQQGNEQNKVQTNTNINNNEQNNIQVQPPNPQMTYPPNYYQYYFAYPKQIMYMPYQIQKNLQGVNNQNNNNMNDMQQQKEKKQENEKKENKKEKEKEKEKKKSRHSRKRSRSRDRSRSKSRNKNKSRSSRSRRSNSSSSRSEGRSKYSKSYK